MRSDELEAAWEFCTPILDAWKTGPAPAFPNYAAGTWGPAASDEMLAQRGHVWRNPQPAS